MFPSARKRNKCYNEKQNLWCFVNVALMFFTPVQNPIFTYTRKASAMFIICCCMHYMHVSSRDLWCLLNVPLMFFTPVENPIFTYTRKDSGIFSTLFVSPLTHVTTHDQFKCFSQIQIWTTKINQSSFTYWVKMKYSLDVFKRTS